MDRAINKSTGEIVNAIEVYKDGSYQNLTKGEWISPKDSIYNWEDISEEDSYIFYVREGKVKYKNGNEGLRRPHFSIYAHSKAKTKKGDPLHDKLKNWLFEKIYINKDNLELIYSTAGKKYKYNNIIKLSEFKSNIDWKNYDTEVTTNSYKKLRADILLPFIEKDPLFGKGIIIEIQLSKQNKKITFDRTIDRAIHGYSVVWLFEKDFEIDDNKEYFKLKKDKVKIYSYLSQLKYQGKEFIDNLVVSVENQCRYLDIKKEECIEKGEELDNKKEEIYEELKKQTNSFFEFKIKEISENFNEEITKKVESNFFEKNKEEIKKIIEESLQQFLDFKLIQETINKIDLNEVLSDARTLMYQKIKNYNLYREVISNPPKCNGCQSFLIMDNGYYGLWWKCPGYKLKGCRSKNSHSIPTEIKSLFKDD